MATVAKTSKNSTTKGAVKKPQVKKEDPKIDKLITDIQNISIAKSVLNKNDEVSGTTETKTDNLIDKNVKDKNIEWLENEIDRLSQENEKYKEEYTKIFEELKKYKAMPNGSAGSNEFTIAELETIKRGVGEIYLDLSAAQKRWDSANIGVLLEKFRNKFNFIH